MAEAWSYIQSGKTVGPVTEEALRDLLASGQLGQNDLVWHQGLPDWTKASQFPELQPRIALAVPPPAPAPSPWTPPKHFAMDEAAPTPLDARASVAGALQALRATKPWVRFLGIMGILGTVIIALACLGMLAFSQVMFKGMPAGLRMVIPLVYLVLGLLQLPPVIFLNRYASRIGDLLRSEAPEDLVRALEAQKSFWKFVGIFTLVLLCFYALIFVIAFGTAMVAGGARHIF